MDEERMKKIESTWSLKKIQLVYLPETNTGPENRPFQKGK